MSKLDTITFVDFDGNPLVLKPEDDRLVVASFAGRSSAGRLVGWMNEQVDGFRQAFPDTRITFLSVADLAEVPRAARRVVRPVLAKVLEQVRKHSMSAGVDRQFEFVLAPDWTGDLRRAFSVSPSRDFRIVIARGDRILDVLTERDPNLAGALVAAIAKGAGQYYSAAA